MNSQEFASAAQAAFSNGDYRLALDLTCTAESEGKACCETLLIQAASIQLAEESEHALDRALDMYLQLLAERPNDSRVLVETAYFYLNVRDQPLSAIPHLKNAIIQLTSALREASDALIRASGETGTEADLASALSCIVSEIETTLPSDAASA